MSPIAPQPLLVVEDVPRARDWYVAVLGLRSSHGGQEYERLLDEDRLVLQLHHRGTEHHHGPLAADAVPLGNGVLVWFAVDDLDALAARAAAAGAEVVRPVEVNPNAGHRELWLRDPDGYVVVAAGS